MMFIDQSTYPHQHQKLRVKIAVLTPFKNKIRDGDQNPSIKMNNNQNPSTTLKVKMKNQPFQVSSYLSPSIDLKSFTIAIPNEKLVIQNHSHYHKLYLKHHHHHHHHDRHYLHYKSLSSL